MVYFCKHFHWYFFRAKVCSSRRKRKPSQKMMHLKGSEMTICEVLTQSGRGLKSLSGMRRQCNSRHHHYCSTCICFSNIQWTIFLQLMHLYHHHEHKMEQSLCSALCFVADSIKVILSWSTHRFEKTVSNRCKESKAQNSNSCCCHK